MKGEVVASSRACGRPAGFPYDIRDILAVDPVTDRQAPVVRAVAGQVERVLGRAAELVVSPGTYDQKHIARIGKLDDCIAYGPGILDLAHQPDEYVVIDDMVDSAKVMAAAAHASAAGRSDRGAGTAQQPNRRGRHPGRQRRGSQRRTGPRWCCRKRQPSPSTCAAAPRHPRDRCPGALLPGRAGPCRGAQRRLGLRAGRGRRGHGWLAAQGRGFAVGDHVVPIVPAAILFDLHNGGDKDWGEAPPYRELGQRGSRQRRRTCPRQRRRLLRRLGRAVERRPGHGLGDRPRRHCVARWPR